MRRNGQRFLESVFLVNHGGGSGVHFEIFDYHLQMK